LEKQLIFTRSPSPSNCLQTPQTKNGQNEASNIQTRAIFLFSYLTVFTVRIVVLTGHL